MHKLGAEAFGTYLITMSVIGSGIMASNLTDDVAIQLLLNCLSTVAILYFSITVFSGISGSHFNPMVSIFALGKQNFS